MIIGNEDRSADGRKPTVEHNGKTYWPSYYMAKIHAEMHPTTGSRVARWVKRPGSYCEMRF